VFDTDLEGFCRSDNEAYSDGLRKLEGDSRLQRLIQQAKGSFPTAQVVTNAGDRPGRRLDDRGEDLRTRLSPRASCSTASADKGATGRANQGPTLTVGDGRGSLPSEVAPWTPTAPASREERDCLVGRAAPERGGIRIVSPASQRLAGRKNPA
jgi:hypothetical protein